MENPFKKVIEEKELPAYLKEKVLDDINIIKLTLDLSELFFVNLPDSALSFFRDNPKENKKNNK
ncbi:hypothetical protein [Avrilella dinanensis]|uniref:Uncharacterized protein n=1 Tax=Avrilella dinanensis TaxID=2008672 RepID=A0A2M9R3Z6_9FLAO|nr:hypothetical protein [Avrilella dinanensis]PJR03596.1 hypothetical protein CDL10_02985 [Avrilella dinanensis]